MARVYVFDLDHVLYPLGHPLGGQTMEGVRQRCLEISGWDEAQMDAFAAEHPSFLHAGAGFCAKFNVEVTTLLDSYHNHVDYSTLEACALTRRGLEALPGKRVIYTDGTMAHAALTLEALGLEGLFEEIHDISLFNAQKRLVDFREFMQRAGISGADVTFVEDNLYNLASAHAAGVRTVWISPASEKPEHVVEISPTLLAWLEAENAASAAA